MGTAARLTRCLAALVLLLATVPTWAAHVRDRAENASIRGIARCGRIRMGYATQEDLAKGWGEGQTITGGHSNSGGLWRVKGTSWILHTDGFEYSKQGLVVDALEPYADPKRIPLRAVRETARARFRLAPRDRARACRGQSGADFETPHAVLHVDEGPVRRQREGVSRPSPTGR